MNKTITAGNKGPKVREDCLVTFETRQGGRLDIHAESESLRSLAEQIFKFFGIEQGHICIEDSGAPDFVFAARIEACVKQMVKTEKNFLPDMIAENHYPLSKKRMRLSRLYLPGNTPENGTYCPDLPIRRLLHGFPCLGLFLTTHFDSQVGGCNVSSKHSLRFPDHLHKPCKV